VKKPVMFHCVLDSVSHLYYYGQKRRTPFVQSRVEVMSICHHSQVCLNMVVVFKSLCHQQLDHFHEEEKDSNWD